MSSANELARARLAALNRHVAEAFEAWLSEPSDTNIWARLIAARETRRMFLNPPLDADPGRVAGEASPVDGQDDELLDELGADDPAVRVGELIEGDPKAVLTKLRLDAVTAQLAGERPAGEA